MNEARNMIGLENAICAKATVFQLFSVREDIPVFSQTIPFPVTSTTKFSAEEKSKIGFP